MTNVNEVFVSKTESVCPVCLRKVEAKKVQIEEDIYLKKICPEHGEYNTVIWRGQPDYKEWNIHTNNTPPLTVLKNKDLGCPYDCGVCSEHQQQACCVLVEITKGCNQNCSFCFASANDDQNEPSIREIEEWFKYLISISEERPFNIQISGGEPTVRDDLPEIIRLGKQLGLPYIQLNTNGLKLGDLEYVRALKEAGLSAVFLQFDGTNDEIYEKLRGQKLLENKLRAIEHCASCGLGVALVPTLVPRVNTDNIGEMIQFALENLPTVRGIHFQPVSYFGKFPKEPSNEERITLPEVITKIEEQTSGRIKSKDLKPLQSGCPICSFKGSFVYMEDGQVHSISDEDSACSCQCSQDKHTIVKTRDFIKRKWEVKQGEKAQIKSSQYDFSIWDNYINRVKAYGFSLTGMAFQDAWNMDLQRLKKCSVHVLDGERKALIPFCAFNLTNVKGEALYRR